MNAIIDQQYVGNLPVYGPDSAGFVEHWCDTVKVAAFAAGYKQVRTPLLFKSAADAPLVLTDEGHHYAIQSDRRRAHAYIAAKTVISYRDLPLRIYELVPSYRRMGRGLEMDWRFEFRCYHEEGLDNEAERLLVLDIWNKVKPVDIRPECFVTADAGTVDVDYVDRTNGSRQAKCVSMTWPDMLDIFELKKVYLA